MNEALFAQAIKPNVISLDPQLKLQHEQQGRDINTIKEGANTREQITAPPDARFMKENYR